MLFFPELELEDLALLTFFLVVLVLIADNVVLGDGDGEELGVTTPDFRPLIGLICNGPRLVAVVPPMLCI
jgi:hypothetical protein